MPKKGEGERRKCGHEFSLHAHSFVPKTMLSDPRHTTQLSRGLGKLIRAFKRFSAPLLPIWNTFWAWRFSLPVLAKQATGKKFRRGGEESRTCFVVSCQSNYSGNLQALAFPLFLTGRAGKKITFLIARSGKPASKEVFLARAILAVSKQVLFLNLHKINPIGRFPKVFFLSILLSKYFSISEILTQFHRTTILYSQVNRKSYETFLAYGRAHSAAH